VNGIKLAPPADSALAGGFDGNDMTPQSEPRAHAFICWLHNSPSSIAAHCRLDYGSYYPAKPGMYPLYSSSDIAVVGWVTITTTQELSCRQSSATQPMALPVTVALRAVTRTL
jgi:hypothetical protein